MIARPSPPILVKASVWLVVSAVIGVLAALASSTAERSYSEQRFHAATDRATHELETQVKSYEHGLRGMRSAIIPTGVDGLTLAGFRAILASRDPATEFPGLLGFGFMKRVSPADLPAYVERMRSDGRPEFHLITLQEHPGDLYVVQYLEPVAANPGATGFDSASDPPVARAIAEASQEGKAAISAPVTLLQAPDMPNHGFVLVLPVYDSYPPLSTPALRADATRGVVFAPLNISDVLSGFSTSHPDLALHLTDIDDSGTRTSVFDTDTGASSVSGMHDVRRLTVFGRTWEATYTPTSAFVGELNLVPPGVAVAIALLLGGRATYVRYRDLTSVARLRASEAQVREANGALESTVRARTADLTRARETLASILERAPNAILVCDVEGRIRMANHQVEALFGYSAEELLGQAVEVLVPEPLRPGHRTKAAGFASDTAHGSTMRGDAFLGRHKDGHSIPVAIGLNSLDTAEGRLVVADIIDVTEQRRHQEALTESVQAAEAANRAKSSFLANMSHEIRTPLNAILGLGQLLERTRLEPQQRETVHKIRVSGQILLTLINDILDLSKIESGELNLEVVPFSLGDVLDEVAGLLDDQASARGTRLTFDPIPSAVPNGLIGDPFRLRQILLNLLTNALKFTEAGEVGLAVRLVSQPEPASVQLRFEVRDTGIGMTPEVLGRLFVPFTQADQSTTRRFGGTGLGLSIVKELTDAMAGSVAAESRPGVGSTFSVELPFRVQATRSTPTDTAAQAPAARPDGGWLAGVRALVVDDNDINLEVAAHLLETEGAVVSTGTNGADALAWLRDPAHRVDVVLMDVQMPVMDGNETVRRIRSEPALAGLPVVALTAGALQSEREQSLRAGMDDYLTKPLDLRQVVEVVLRLVHHP